VAMMRRERLWEQSPRLRQVTRVQAPIES
jgi:hypothetical protein